MVTSQNNLTIHQQEESDKLCPQSAETKKDEDPHLLSQNGLGDILLSEESKFQHREYNMIIMYIQKNTNQKCTDRNVWKDAHQTGNSRQVFEGCSEAIFALQFEMFTSSMSSHILNFKKCKSKMALINSVTDQLEIISNRYSVGKSPCQINLLIPFCGFTEFVLSSFSQAKCFCCSRECFYCKLECQLHEDRDHSVLLIIISLMLSTVSGTQQVFRYLLNECVTE